ncbi:hypothetical protein LWI28_027919 [Acer negundo]|uniref:Uncharacterized protein n=1 Tax=Acer negundo TaxID=4023 RepID=A0AAD5JC20_ACENE|nr:hypothetical protein LWI28_027919 [Acer negundo]
MVNAQGSARVSIHQISSNYNNNGGDYRAIDRPLFSLQDGQVQPLSQGGACADDQMQSLEWNSTAGSGYLLCAEVNPWRLSHQ